MKPGYRTTEFWIAALTAAGTVLASLRDVVPPALAAKVAAASAAAYAISRGLAKFTVSLDPADQPDDTPPVPPPAPDPGRTLMLLGALSILLLPSVTGCTSLSRLTTARIQIQCGTNSVQIAQPKDTTIKTLRFNPATGALELHGYASSANAAAIASATAQWEAADSIVSKSIGFAQQGIEAYLRMTGIPIPAAPAVAPTNSLPPAVPRTVVVTNGPTARQPHLEINGAP